MGYQDIIITEDKLEDDGKPMLDESEEQTYR